MYDKHGHVRAFFPPLLRELFRIYAHPLFNIYRLLFQRHRWSSRLGMGYRSDVRRVNGSAERNARAPCIEWQSSLEPTLVTLQPPTQNLKGGTYYEPYAKHQPRSHLFRSRSSSSSNSMSRKENFFPGEELWKIFRPLPIYLPARGEKNLESSRNQFPSRTFQIPYYRSFHYLWGVPPWMVH